MMCLTPDQFAAFIGVLDPSMLEGTMTGIIVNATSGPINWVWVAASELWCINGNVVTPGVGR